MYTGVLWLRMLYQSGLNCLVVRSSENIFHSNKDQSIRYSGYRKIKQLAIRHFFLSFF